MAGSSVNDSLNTLDVGLPCAIGTSVGVGNLDTEGYALITKITLSHFIAPPIRMISQQTTPNHRRLDMITNFPEKCKHFFQNFLFFSKYVDIPVPPGYNDRKCFLLRGVDHD